MLSKCVNPVCPATFRYLHEGKVFRLDRADLRSDNPKIHARNFEYFWLCAKCASFLTVVFEQHSVNVRPLHLALPASSLPLAIVDTGRAA